MTTETVRASMTTSVEMMMRRFDDLARSLMLIVLAAGAITACAPCAAEEPDPPTPPGVAAEHGSLFAPSAWMVLSTPVQERIDLKVYGFYIGELDVPVAQVDLPIRTTKFLTVTPSYMYYSVPASGLNELSPQPVHFTDSYDEHQFRVDGTLVFPVHGFEISGRGMYVRRFRPTPLADTNRYRGRIGIARPMVTGGHIWKPFASYESFYEETGGWDRERVWSGVTLQLTKHVFVQPSYLWETNKGSRDIDYLLFGLIVNTNRPVRSSSTTLKGDSHVESVEAFNHDARGDDRQPGVRLGSAGSDADVTLEEGRAIPGAR